VTGPGGQEAGGEAGYAVPAGVHRVEDSVRRSRFLTTLAPAPDPTTAQELIRSVREEFPDATHHCWAFVAGPPGSTAQIGMSDDGEPHGTAGRPILNTLLHSELGEVVAVVTRWFGGVKLGKGGLGRAYAVAVTHALDTAPTVRKVELGEVIAHVGFAHVDALYRLLDSFGAVDRREAWQPDGSLQASVRIPLGLVETLTDEVASITSGEGGVWLPGEGRDDSGGSADRP